MDAVYVFAFGLIWAGWCYVVARTKYNDDGDFFGLGDIGVTLFLAFILSFLTVLCISAAVEFPGIVLPLIVVLPLCYWAMRKGTEAPNGWWNSDI